MWVQFGRIITRWSVPGRSSSEPFRRMPPGAEARPFECFGDLSLWQEEILYGTHFD